MREGETERRTEKQATEKERDGGIEREREREKDGQREREGWVVQVQVKEREIKVVPGSSGGLVEGDRGDPWEEVELEGDKITGASPFTDPWLSLDILTVHEKDSHLQEQTTDTNQQIMKMR